MILLNPSQGDDEQFVETVERIVENVVSDYRPAEVYVIHVDNWFDHKWRKFSGVVHLQVGTWAWPWLRLPPFNPNGILGQIHLRLNQFGEPIQVESSGRTMHIHQYSGSNLHRRLNEMTESGLFVWYSGATDSNH